MSDMADVIREQFTVETTGEYDATAVWATPEEIIAALSAAGFGPAREARAEAWDEGYDKGTDLAAWAIGNRPQSERPNTDNPYREDA